MQTTTKPPKTKDQAESLPPEITTLRSLLDEHGHLEKRGAAAAALQAKLEPETRALYRSTDLEDESGFEVLARKKLQLEVIPAQLEEIERRCEEIDSELEAPVKTCLRKITDTLRVIQAGLGELGGRAMKEHFATIGDARRAALDGPKPTATAVKEREFDRYSNYYGKDAGHWISAARKIVRDVADIRAFEEERKELESQMPEGIPTLQEIYGR